MCNLSNPIFHNEDKARAYLEAQRWPDGAVCPFCGQLDRVTAATMQDKQGQAVPGWYHCKDCRKRFTVRVGTLYERSHIPLHKWLMATHLLVSSKKGMSAHQLHRMLGVTYKTAWFMAHRIREGMRDDDAPAIGGEGKVIEADETYFGNKDVIKKRTRRGKAAHSSKRSVLSLVERGGNVRSFHVKHATAEGVRDVIVRNADRKSRLHTDESRLYTVLGGEFAKHETVMHSAHEYARGDVTTNSVEGFFSIFKRGMRGVYQHCGEAHLFRYLAEFDFRYNHRKVSDAERADAALKGIEGKRLTYRRIGEARLA